MVWVGRWPRRTAWILLKVLSFRFTPKATESSAKTRNETRVHPVSGCPSPWPLVSFHRDAPPEGGGVGQWEEDIHYTGGMQNLRLDAFILPTTRNNKNTTILLLKPCNAGLKRKPQSCSCAHLGAVSPVYTWAAGRQLLARKEPSELLEGLLPLGRYRPVWMQAAQPPVGACYRALEVSNLSRACLSDPCLRVSKGSGLHSGGSQT